MLSYLSRRQGVQGGMPIKLGAADHRLDRDCGTDTLLDTRATSIALDGLQRGARLRWGARLRGGTRLRWWIELRLN